MRLPLLLPLVPFLLCPLLLSQQKTAPNPKTDAPSGVLSGRVVFAGKALPPAKPVIANDKEVCAKHEIVDESLLVDPQTNGLANVVVEVERKVKYRWDGKTKYELDQKGCVFVPHVLVVPRRAEIELKNSDDVLHNIHTYARLNRPFNLGVPAHRSVKRKVSIPDRIKVACDVHKWMSAWIYVARSPHHALTKRNGTFEIRGIPPGRYQVRIWHEKLGTIREQVDIQAGRRSLLTPKLGPDASPGGG